MSVKVGVRVRPYNQREKDLNCRLCVDMMGPKTRLFDADEPQKHRDFTFDYSFWSHDQFHTDEKGYFKGDNEKYADQQHVFEQVGLQILSNAWEGYHCCLFAYGQTGAGKSYSMVGYGANKGIVPISCEQIFRRISNNEDKNKEYEINVSMLEIYNEKVQDLLVPINKRNKEGYKIREHKTLGIYVEGLSKHYVDTYKAIEEKMNDGSQNRSIAATQMNASSSRAHTIISIEFRQKELVQGKKRQKLSVIYLVDLAGSQKVGKTGATGDRLKQAAGINKSLSVLGLVISTLADKASGKGKGIVVPYRDSCLTRILQNALGGNSKTLMICAISPATDNYEQTLSTLRYADQAKKIQNKAIVNQSETDKMIRNLTAEKDELRDKVAKFQEMFKKLSEGLGIDPEKMKEFDETKEQLRFNTMMMNDYSMTKTQKLQQEQEIEKDNLSSIKKVDTTKPHFSNLNQDPQLSRRINYSIFEEKTTIGRRNTEPENKIQIGGMGIRSLHAVITKDEQNHIFLEPIFTGGDSSCYLNGDAITEKTQLWNMDRVIFGTNNFFIVILPEQKPRDQIQQNTVDWEFAQNQMYLKKEQIQKQQNEEREKKIKQEAQSILKEKEDQLAELQRKLQENEEMRKNLQVQKQIERSQMQRKLREQEAQKLRQEIEKNKKKIKSSENLQKQRIKDKYIFEKKLTKSLPKCIELNLIAKEFKKNINLSVKMLMHNDDEEDDLQIKKRTMKVKVTNHDQGYSYWWDSEKLSNRYYIIKDMAQTYFETGMLPQLDKTDDPFWDPPEPTLIGKSFLTTKALAYLFDNRVTLSIIGENDQCGDLIVDMIPTNETGQKNLSEELEEEQLQCEPEQLVGKPFYYNMVIESAIVPNNFRNVYVQYNMKTTFTKQETFKTQAVQQKTASPVFNYKHLHIYPSLSQNLLEYLLNAKIVYKVYGVEVIAIKNQEKQEKASQQLTDNTQSNASGDEKPKKKKNGSSKKKSSDKKEKNEETPLQKSPKNMTDQSRARNEGQGIKKKQKKPTHLPSQGTKDKDNKQDCKIF